MTRNPGAFAVAVITLALGIGANTAMFSVIHAALLRPLPVRDPQRLVIVSAAIRHLNITNAQMEYNTVTDWFRARSSSFESMVAWTPGSANLMIGDQPRRVRTLRVGAGYFSMLGAPIALGRDFAPEEDRPGANRVAILTDAIWRQSFAGERNVVGRPIVLDRNSYTVIGVLAPEYDLNREEIFVPLAQNSARAPGQPTVGVYARLKPHASIETAQAEIDSISRAWVAQYNYPKDWNGRVWPLRGYLVRDVQSSLVVLSVAVVLVLLIACANVANLLLARAGARRREIAVRCALGAARARIFRQLLTESCLLGVISSAIGLPLAWALGRLLTEADLSMPFLRHVSINGPVLGFTAAAALLTTVLFGLAPAFATAQAGLSSDLREGGRGSGETSARTRFRAALVVAEVALALLLVIGATLTVRSLARLQSVHPGFNSAAVLTTDLVLPPSIYPDPARRVAFYQDLLQRTTAIPGVRSAGIVSNLPFSGTKSGSDITIEDAPPPAAGDRLIAFSRTVDPEYFRTLQVPLLRGRFFTPLDTGANPVAIVNETMARRCWPSQDAVGKRFAIGRSGRWLTVLGVVGNIRSTSLADEPDLEFFTPHAMSPGGSMAVVVRTGMGPAQLTSALRSAVRQLDKELPVPEVKPLAAGISRSIGTRRVSVGLLAAFALLALVLASVGIYGLISYSVARRTHEIGVRIALGAARGQIAALVVGRALWLGSIGVLAGIGGSLALTRLLRSMLYNVSATDPAVFVAASLFLLAVSAVAAYLPARRAARVDPVVALREE